MNVKLAMYALTMVGFIGLLHALLRFVGEDLSPMADKQPILEAAFAMLLVFPAFWVIRKLKTTSLRTIGLILVAAFVFLLAFYIAPDDFTRPEGKYSDIFPKVLAPVILIAFMLVTALYEKKRNEKAAKGYVLRFGMAFKKVCEGYGAVSEEGCSMRNTPYGIEFYDAEGNSTGFRPTDIATKWKVVKEGSE